MRSFYSFQRLRRSSLAILAVTAGLALPGVGDAAQIDVGSGGAGAGCEATTITQALGLALAAGADEIRLTTSGMSYLNQNIATLTNWDNAGAGPLTISGGWTNCNSVSQSGRTLVDGIGSDPVFTIEATAGRTSIINLARLEIVGGTRGVFASGNSDVHLVSVDIHANSGGILASTGANIDVDLNSLIRENVGGTLLGGGVYCSDAGSEIFMRGLVRDNSSTSAGGGIFAQSSCHVALQDGAYVSSNESPIGAGLHVQSGATVTGGGTGQWGVRINGNTASNEGGGLRVVGAGTSVLLGNARVFSNTAANRGGGVSVGNGGSVQLERFNFEQCAAPPRCATLSNNTLTVGGNGSAVYAGIGGQFRMYQGFIEQNTGPAEAGFAIYAEDVDTDIYLEGIQIWDNRTVSMFEAQASAEIVAGNVSAARNDYLVGGGPTRLDSRGGQASSGASIRLFTGILEDQRDFVANTGTIEADCMILDSAGGLTSQFGSMVGVDPGFRDPDSGNLRLRLDSVAIDACDNLGFNPIDSDYDVDSRGWDLPSKPNNLGAFDRGADEIRPLFADGFETGNTSAWSLTVP